MDTSPKAAPRGGFTARERNPCRIPAIPHLPHRSRFGETWSIERKSNGSESVPRENVCNTCGAQHGRVLIGGLRMARGGHRRTHTETAWWELNFDCRGATILLMKYLAVCFMALGLAAQAQTIK